MLIERKNRPGKRLMKRIMGEYSKRVIIAAAWILVWQLAAWLVDNRILLVGPLETVRVLGERALRGSFWLTVGTSLLRIGAGFAAGLALGLLLATASGRFPLMDEVLAPVMSLLKAIPVASFVVLFLIWWRSGVLATAVSFCVVLPNIYVNTLEGIRHVDRRLLEMAKVLRIPAWNRFFYIYRPALKPYLDSAIRVSVGMSWKSGVAAEVIGVPALSVGEQLYLSKIYLDTAGVLAWTAVTILASVVCEKAVLALWRQFQRWEPQCRAAREGVFQAQGRRCPVGNGGRRKTLQARGRSGAGIESSAENGRRREAIQGRIDGGPQSIAQGISSQDKASPDARVALELTHISKSYHGRTVLQDVTASYERGQTYYFHSPSGSGKTTLFRLIAGLEEPDGRECGSIKAAKSGIDRHGSRISMVFQEDRLCEEYSALVNVDMVTGDREKSREHLNQLLAEEDLHKPCRELSGGMKRRVAIARAMAAGGDVILLDEPFGGLDTESRLRTERYIRRQGAGSALLVATHTGHEGTD